MPTGYSGNPAVYPATVNIPSHGDPDELAEINHGLSDLADRTANMRGRLDYAIDMAIMSWTAVIRDQFNDLLLDNTVVRPTDDTADAFWSNVYHMWIVCGSNTSGGFFTCSASNVLGFVASGAASPPKVTFGAETQGRILLFNSDLNAPGVRPKMLQSGTVNLGGGWTTREVTTTATPETVSTNSATYDAVQVFNLSLSIDRVLIVGGRDGHHKCWTTDDGGATFVEREVGLIGSGAGTSVALNRVLVGRGQQIVAFSNTTAGGNGGDVMHISNDRGYNWFPVSPVAFDQIADGIYVEELDRYFFVTGTDVWSVDDPSTGSGTWTQVTVGPGIDLKSIVYVGGALVAVAEISGGAKTSLVRSRDAGATWQFMTFMPNAQTLAVAPTDQLALWTPQLFATSLAVKVPGA